MHIRPFQRPDDLPLVLGFLEAVEAATGVPPLGESKFVDLAGPGEGSGLIGGGAAISAYVYVLDHPASRLTEMELVAAPDATDEELTSMVEAVADQAEQRLLWWTFGETRAASFAAGRMPTFRTLHKLTGSLPIAEPPPILTEVRVAGFRPGVDDDVWLAVNNAAFSGHPENGAWTQADLDLRLGRDWFDPDGFRLTWVGEQLAGFCWTKRHGEEAGEIYVVAVDPAFQGRGLGRLIVLEALWYLANVGCTNAHLYVDTANESALELYQSLGLSLARVDRCFEVPKDWPQDPQ
ncbi:MAG: mycothiol synthase [Acidimicrobiia bacterium]